MLATSVRPMVLRTARNALPRTFARPLGVSVRAYKEDTSREHKEVPTHKEQNQVQKHEGSGMMRADPYMRYAAFGMPATFVTHLKAAAWYRCISDIECFRKLARRSFACDGLFPAYMRART